MGIQIPPLSSISHLLSPAGQRPGCKVFRATRLERVLDAVRESEKAGKKRSKGGHCGIRGMVLSSIYAIALVYFVFDGGFDSSGDDGFS